MIMPRARFQLLDLLHNPVNNLALAQQNLIDHLSADIQALPHGADAGRLVSYRLVDRVAREILREEHRQQFRGTLTAYQFEVRLIPPLATPIEAVTILTSPEQSWI